MNYTIANDFLRVSFSDHGGECQSIYNVKDGYEALWQGDPDLWGERAPLLFPWCGRMNRGIFLHDGKTYEAPLHGFARHMTMEVAEQTENSISFTLRDTEETRKIYPFAFLFKVTYTLNENRLTTSFTVENPDDTQTLPFSLGGHPGFTLELPTEEAFSEYYLEFPDSPDLRYIEMKKAHPLSRGNFPPFALREGKYWDLKREYFTNQINWFFANTGSSVILASRSSKRKITVSLDEFRYLGVWQIFRGNPAYLCLEPWDGLPDIADEEKDIMDKYAVTLLPPKKTKTLSFTITVD